MNDNLKILLEFDSDNERCIIKEAGTTNELRLNCGDYYEMCECLETFIQAYIEQTD